MPRPRDIAQRVSRYQPILVDGEDRVRAAVAVVLRGQDDQAEVLFIERASRTGDPWSGHMAFPGGRLDPSDEGTREAAERETLEEVGVCLADGSYLGRLDDLEGRPERNDRMVVSAYVYHMADPEPLRLNHEVREAFWFPVSELLASERHVTYPTRPTEASSCRASWWAFRAVTSSGDSPTASSMSFSRWSVHPCQTSGWIFADSRQCNPYRRSGRHPLALRPPLPVGKRG